MPDAIGPEEGEGSINHRHLHVLAACVCLNRALASMWTQGKKVDTRQKRCIICGKIQILAFVAMIIGAEVTNYAEESENAST